MKLFLFVSLFTAALLGCGDATPCVPGSCDDGNPCTEDTCNASDDVCVHEGLADGLLCEATSGRGVCVEGRCATQACASVVCDDGNPCTIDACVDELGACVGIVGQDMVVCEIDGVFGRCRAGVCDESVAPRGSVSLELTIADLEPASVAYTLDCASGISLSGTLTRAADGWTGSFTLPAGTCTLEILARDGDGEIVCDGDDTVTIAPDSTTTVQAVLTCED